MQLPLTDIIAPTEAQTAMALQVVRRHKRADIIHVARRSEQTPFDLGHALLDETGVRQVFDMPSNREVQARID